MSSNQHREIEAEDMTLQNKPDIEDDWQFISGEDCQSPGALGKTNQQDNELGKGHGSTTMDSTVETEEKHLPNRKSPGMQQQQQRSDTEPGAEVKTVSYPQFIGSW